MATPGAEPLVGQPVASPPPPGHIGANGGAAPPNSRGLERALEEATLSGALNLSARKLKEFPRTAAGVDLSDTVEADLSKNRLSDVPSEVCHLVALESLNLYHNCIRSIPDGVISLHSLTWLNLSRNQLSSLPACLCTLPLRVLNASNNKLVSLPESVGQLRRLMELDISCNELTTLPRHIGRLRALRELNVRRNLLCVLPEDLADLPLVKLDFSCNKVSTIPLSYRKMVRLQALRLENNPLQSPPAQICLKGKVHIFKYLSTEACRSDKMADALYLPVMERLSLMRGEDSEQQRKQDSDSGVDSDVGDKRLSATEPSDEDTLSLNVPMSHITEEDGLSKDDSSEHISSLTDPSSEAARLTEESPSERPPSEPLYGKGRTAAAAPDSDEPLRIDEDFHWTSEHESKVTGDDSDVIGQLKEAAELVRNPGRINLEQEELCGVRLYPVERLTADPSVNGQDSDDEGGGGAPKRLNRSPSRIPTMPAAPFGLKPRSAPSSLACSPPLSPTRLSQAPPLCGTCSRGKGGAPQCGRSGPGWRPDRKAPPARAPSQFAKQPAAGANDWLALNSKVPPSSSTSLSTRPCCSVFLRSHKSVECVDPQFTMRRKMEQLREELELMEQLRDSIESRLKVVLPDDLGSSLMDGVVLCHLANYIRPRSVASIHVPSPAVPKLSMAKCRRNVENFLDACRKMGVPESSLCSAYDIIQCRLPPLCATVRTLVGGKRSEAVRPLNKKAAAPDSVSATTQTPPPAWRWWDLIGCSLVHLFCLLLLFAVYLWSELT
ncbi:leucine-rich repeat and calponin homology domain-containing protein 1 isoform X1 [Syngnathus scovelli]|uniref:leucine-rich repeat and calponin homology domain-containing protein 1 isoform X1 n=1 Tax=Syngnathus scovelli TaxID=161590 RepID=UPI00210F2F19|nr:leucine-rich repeat and calponin homology domain-containing protein 1 isoform X1 [Syngnathus scovelli]